MSSYFQYSWPTPVQALSTLVLVQWTTPKVGVSLRPSPQPGSPALGPDLAQKGTDTLTKTPLPLYDFYFILFFNPIGVLRLPSSILLHFLSFLFNYRFFFLFFKSVPLAVFIMPCINRLHVFRVFIVFGERWRLDSLLWGSLTRKPTLLFHVYCCWFEGNSATTLVINGYTEKVQLERISIKREMLHSYHFIP